MSPLRHGPDQAPSLVFICYRRGEAGGHAGRLHGELTRRFGNDAVFFDHQTISYGSDFETSIEQAIGENTRVLVIVGPDWLKLVKPTADGPSHDPSDQVVREIRRAFDVKARVVPVLVHRAQMPAAGELPAEIRDFAKRHASPLSDDRWDYDVARLVRSLAIPWWHRPRDRLIAAAASLVAAMVAVTTAYLAHQPSEVHRTEPTASASSSVSQGAVTFGPSARPIETLETHTAAAAKQFFDQATQSGLHLRVTRTLSTKEEQEALFAQGRDGEGPTVTNARPETSSHVQGRAFDAVLVDTTGHPLDLKDHGYETLAAIAENVGLTRGRRDPTHFELPEPPIDQALDRIRKTLDVSPLKQRIGVTYEFDLSGSEGGVHAVSITKEGSKVSHGHPKDPSVTLTMSARDFVDAFLLQKIKVGGLFMSSRLKIAGDFSLVQQLTDSMTDSR